MSSRDHQSSQYGANNGRSDSGLPSRPKYSRTPRKRASSDNFDGYSVGGSTGPARTSIYQDPVPESDESDDDEHRPAPFPTCESVLSDDVDEYGGYENKPVRRRDEQARPAPTPASTTPTTPGRNYPSGRAARTNPDPREPSSASSSTSASERRQGERPGARPMIPNDALFPDLQLLTQKINWDRLDQPTEVLLAAYQILPNCAHWESEWNNGPGCHPTPVLGWEHGRHSRTHSATSTGAELDLSGKYLVPEDGYMSTSSGGGGYSSSGPSPGSDRGGSKKSHRVPGWFMVGPPSARFQLRACSSCISGIRKIVPRNCYRFVEMEPQEARNHKCNFSSLILRFGWFILVRMLREWKPSTSLRAHENSTKLVHHSLVLLASAISSSTPCYNDNLRVGEWYSFPYRVGRDGTGRFRLDCLICPQDYRLITTIFPWTSTVLAKIPDDEALCQPHLCSFRFHSTRWGALIRALWTECNGMTGFTPVGRRDNPSALVFYPGNGDRPWAQKPTRRLADVLIEKGLYDRCGHNDSLVNFTWYYIPELPCFTVCHYCHASVVSPLRRLGSPIALAFNARPQRVQLEDSVPKLGPTPGGSRRGSQSQSRRRAGSSAPPPPPIPTASCQLHSARMRDIFNFVAAVEPMETTKSKKRARDARLYEQHRQQVGQYRLSPGPTPPETTDGNDESDYDDPTPAISSPLVNFANMQEAFAYLRERAVARRDGLIQLAKERQQVLREIDSLEQKRGGTQSEKWQDLQEDLEDLDVRFRALD